MSAIVESLCVGGGVEVRVLHGVNRLGGRDAPAWR